MCCWREHEKRVKEDGQLECGFIRLCDEIFVARIGQTRNHDKNISGVTDGDYKWYNVRNSWNRGKITREIKRMKICAMERFGPIWGRCTVGLYDSYMRDSPNRPESWCQNQKEIVARVNGIPLCVGTSVPWTLRFDWTKNCCKCLIFLASTVHEVHGTRNVYRGLGLSWFLPDFFLKSTDM